LAARVLLLPLLFDCCRSIDRCVKVWGVAVKPTTDGRSGGPAKRKKKPTVAKKRK